MNLLLTLQFDFQKNYLKRNLETKVKRLEANVTLLQTKVNEQESLLLVLKRQVGGVQLKIQEPRQVAIHRTCHEVRAANSSLPSGMYWIDPDGQGVGDDPINVACDMTSGYISNGQHDKLVSLINMNALME